MCKCESADVGTDSSWLFGNPNACKGVARPKKASEDTCLISPEDTTRP